MLALLATSRYRQGGVSTYASGPRPPVSIRVRPRLDRTSLRIALKRLERSGVAFTALHAMALTANHVGCHHVEPARHSAYSTGKAGPNLPTLIRRRRPNPQAMFRAEQALQALVYRDLVTPQGRVSFSPHPAFFIPASAPSSAVQQPSWSCTTVIHF